MGADRVAGQLRGDKGTPSVAKYGRVWRKLPESDARSLEEVAGKRCLEFGGRCRKAMLGVWRKLPESDARSLEEVAGKRCLGCGCLVHCQRLQDGPSTRASRRSGTVVLLSLWLTRVSRRVQSSVDGSGCCLWR